MTRIFTDDGGTLPVTVLDVSDNRVTQIKTAETDGYAAVQVAFGKRRASASTSRSPGISPRRGSRPATCCSEFRAKPEELGEPQGRRQARRRRDLQGRPEGRRAGRDHRQGLRRRHQAPPLRLATRASHGNSISHRARLDRPEPGARAHVFPGKRMPGHLGNEQRTIAGLRSCASTPSASCCWSRARCPAPRGATSSCVRR